MFRRSLRPATAGDESIGVARRYGWSVAVGRDDVICPLAAIAFGFRKQTRNRRLVNVQLKDIGAGVNGQPHRVIAVRATPLRSQRLNDAADEAYATKYTTKANLKYVAGFRTARRKATTLELVPR